MMWMAANKRWLFLLAVCLASWSPARAEMGAAANDLSFEQLGSMEVAGVSKSVERVFDAPAAVSVVTSEEIRAFGFHTLADVLNAVPGFFTYSDRAYSYVGVRGFAPVGSYNSRVLLLIDGFPANDNFFQQALIGNEELVDLALVDRVEVIRGPSSSIYGNNALLGVINVILKNPSQVKSGVEAWAGSGVERGGSATLSGGTGHDLAYFLRISGSGADGQDVIFPPQAGIPSGRRVSGLDGTDSSRAFAKIISGNLRINLAFSERRQQAGYGLYGDVIGYPGSFVRDGTTAADLRYEGNFSEKTDYALRASVAQYRYDSLINDPNPPSTVPLAGDLPIVGNWVDTEATLTHHLSVGNRLVAGVEARRDARENLTASNPQDGVVLRVSNADSYFGIYAQSDIDWSEHWSTSIGVRDDENDHQNHANPRLAVLWKLSPDQVIKLMSGTAYRQASAFERFFSQLPYILPSPNLAPERLRTLDLEYNAQLAAATRIAVTGYRYHATNLISNVIIDQNLGVTQLQNGDSTRVSGVDLSVEQDLTPGLQARLSSSFASATMADGDRAQNAPRWTGRLGLKQELGADWRLGTEAVYASRRLGIDNLPLSPFVVANLSVSRTPRAGRADVTLTVDNLFNHSYAQPVAGWLGDRVDQALRTWRVTVGYPF